MAHTRRIAFSNANAANTALPLLSSSAADVPIAWHRQRPISRGAFIAQVLRVADCLPPRRYALNLCANRYLFLVAFAAVGVRQQTSLLPTSRIKAAIEETIVEFTDNHTVDDALISGLVGDVAGERWADAPVPWLSADHIMAIAFTSGSTGRAQPHAKRWGELVAGAWLAERRFGSALTPGTTIVAAVPPQHMYGLETSIMLPLMLPVALHAARPLLPDEVIAALAAVPAPRVLITTPAHLRVFADTPATWPPLALVISATAPLSASLGRAAERTLAAPVMEIYGCTEAGSIASRRTVDDDAWTPYEGFSIDDGWVHAIHLPEAVCLNDVVEVKPDGRFVLLGRQQDLVNIAGKRTSLAYLNRVLSEIEGVADGVFVVPEEAGDRPVRLAALVVAPTLAKRDVLKALAERIDPIFLPRPLLLADQLPRNDFGKLSREVLLDLVRSGAMTNGCGDG